MDPVAHREGRTRSLQITRSKSLTLYPIELGGRCKGSRRGRSVSREFFAPRVWRPIARSVLRSSRRKTGRPSKLVPATRVGGHLHAPGLQATRRSHSNVQNRPGAPTWCSASVIGQDARTPPGWPRGRFGATCAATYQWNIAHPSCLISWLTRVQRGFNGIRRPWQRTYLSFLSTSVGWQSVMLVCVSDFSGYILLRADPLHRVCIVRVCSSAWTPPPC